MDVRGETKKGYVAAEVKLNAKSPVPMEYGNTGLTGFSGSRYIPFLDGSNSFAKTLLELRILSVTHNACINTKTSYTIGEGLQITNMAEGQTDEKFVEFFKHMNNRKENGNKVLRKIIEGYLAYGNKPIEVVRFSIKGRKFLYIYPKNFLDCRLSWPNENNESTHVLVSKKFRKGVISFGGKDQEEMKEIPIYKAGPGDKKRYWLKDGNVERTMIWFKNDFDGYDHYGLPSAISSISYQKLEYDNVRFNLDNIENNMVLGGAIFLTGQLSQTEANKIGSDIVRKHTGSGKRGRIAVYASEAGVSDAKWVPFDTRKEGSYIEQDDKVQDKIILAHEWDPVLAGMQTKNAIGKGGGYLEEIYNQKLQTVILPLQNKLLEEVWGPIIEIADEWLGTSWSRHNFSIKPARIINKNAILSSEKGIELFLKIIDKVASGAWPLKAAIKFVSRRLGITEQEAEEELGEINVRSKSNKEGAVNQPGGGVR